MAARWWHSRYGGSFLRELVLVVVLLLLYKYGRFLTKGHVDTALHNARDVISLERSLGVFSEARLQDLVLRETTLIRFLNVYYLVAHVAVTAAAFLWLYVRHPPTYRRFRNVMVAITLSGMVVHLVLPLAPPRMFPNLGFVDTARVFGPASVRCGQPVQGLRQPVRGDAVAALRVGARDRVGGLDRDVEQVAVRGAGPSGDHARRHRPHCQPLLARRGRGDVPLRRRARHRPLLRATAEAQGPRIGERRNACAGSTNCRIGDRLTSHVSSGSTARPCPDVGGVLPVVQQPRLTSASMPGVGQVVVAERSAARRVEGMAADSWVPGVTDT